MQQIKHLAWRAGFGLSPAEYEHYLDSNREVYLDDLFRAAANPQQISVPEKPIQGDLREMDRKKMLEIRLQERRRVAEFGYEWLQRMADPSAPALLERMTLFWHGHFACETKLSPLAAKQLNTLRQHALGNFRELVLGIARDPSMIRYLNNQQNRKEQPNENFARELMELFTIGRGAYTEQDVKEAARAFTGWSSTLRGDYVFRHYWHDNGTKSFLGKRGNFNGDDIVDMLLERKQTARFISQKIYRYFVSETPNESREASLAERFYQSGYDIGDLMRFLFEQDWFYAEEVIGSKIKSPVELLAGMMRTHGIRFDNKLAPVFVLRTLGQQLFRPPNVAGWPSGQQWIDNSTLMLRLNLSMALLGNSQLQQRPPQNLKQEARAQQIGRLKTTVTAAPLLRVALQDSPQHSIETLQDILLVRAKNIDPQFIYRHSQIGSAPENTLLASARIKWD